MLDLSKEGAKKRQQEEKAAILTKVYHNLIAAVLHKLGQTSITITKKDVENALKNLHTRVSYDNSQKDDVNTGGLSGDITFTVHTKHAEPKAEQ